jgi:hypothetical protein
VRIGRSNAYPDNPRNGVYEMLLVEFELLGFFGKEKRWDVRGKD